MADLQKMPGGAGLLKKPSEAKRKTKERGSVSKAMGPLGSGGEPRRTPEPVSRRQTRSMGGAKPQSMPKDEELSLELSLEEELLKVFTCSSACTRDPVG